MGECWAGEGAFYVIAQDFVAGTGAAGADAIATVGGGTPAVAGRALHRRGSRASHSARPALSEPSGDEAEKFRRAWRRPAVVLLYDLDHRRRSRAEGAGVADRQGAGAILAQKEYPGAGRCRWRRSHEARLRRAQRRSHGSWR